MKLIDKSALVAEIERWIKHYNLAAKEFGDEGYKDNVLMEQCKASACERILSFLDTLEVKEVDLDEAARKLEDKVYLEKGWQDAYGRPHAPFSEIGNAFREGAKFIIKAQKGE